MTTTPTTTFAVGDLVRRNSSKYGIGTVKGTITQIKANGSVIVRWGDGYRAHKSTVQAKSLVAWDAEVSRAIITAFRVGERHCAAHGNSVNSTIEGHENYCWQCGTSAVDVIDGNEHKRRQREILAQRAVAECMARELGGLAR